MDYLLKLSLAGGVYWYALLLWFPSCFACLALWVALWHRRWWRDIGWSIIVISLLTSILCCGCRVSMKLIDESSQDPDAWLPSQLLSFRYNLNASAAEGTLSLLKKISCRQGEGQDADNLQHLYLAFEAEMLNPSRHCCGGVLEPRHPAAMGYDQLPEGTQEALESFINAPDGGNLMTEEEKLFVHQNLMDCCRTRILSAGADYYRPKLENIRPLCNNLPGIIAVLAGCAAWVVALQNIHNVPPLHPLGNSRQKR